MSFCTGFFPAETIKDGEVLADLFESVDKEMPFFDLINKIDGFLFTEIFGSEVAALPELEIKIGSATAEISFLDTTGGDVFELFEDLSLDVQVVVFGIFEDVDQYFHITLPFRFLLGFV